MKFTSLHNKNQINLEKQKIIFQFSLVSVAAFIAGILFIKTLSSEGITNILDGITKHFATDMPPGTFGKIFIRQCLPDIICILLLYTFSFSFVNYICTDLILAFLAFKFGICTHLCFLAPLSSAATFISLFLRALLLGVILVYSCRIAICSLRLKKILSNGRVAIDIKTFISITLSTVSTVGVALIIYGLYCLL